MKRDPRASLAASLRATLAASGDTCPHGDRPDVCLPCWTTAHDDEQTGAGTFPHGTPEKRSDRHTATELLTPTEVE